MAAAKGANAQWLQAPGTSVPGAFFCPFAPKPTWWQVAPHREQASFNVTKMAPPPNIKPQTRQERHRQHSHSVVRYKNSQNFSPKTWAQLLLK
jgi:hypothetical protein